MKNAKISFNELWKPALIVLALAFLYASVISKLVYDWSTDDNYSHGLLVPFVIAYIVWLKSDDLRRLDSSPKLWAGVAAIVVSLLMLIVGTLGAELFIQRISLVVMLAGVILYFFGSRVLRELVVPFLLILLAIPIPQIIFNKIAFPLQLLASRLAAFTIDILNIASVRHGNVIEIIPAGGGAMIALEVVEACSGIRSLMTLVTLALVLGYLTKDRRNDSSVGLSGFLHDFDKLRILILMLSAVPIALLTNAARVTATAVAVYHYGESAAEGLLHESAGLIVFICAFALLFALNLLLKRFSPGDDRSREGASEPVGNSSSYLPVSTAQTIALFIAILVGGVFVNWFEHRGEVEVSRRPLSEVPRFIGDWEHKSLDLRFDAETEKVLKADDYVMRYYFSPDAWINFYVGFYGSQRTGATYHSPLNCLPGSGWELREPGTVELVNSEGKTFTANRYIVQRGDEREILLYWYQGRGRTNASEYADKIYTSLDGIMKRRTDGAFVRVMIPVGKDEKKAMENAVDFASKVMTELTPFVPN